MRARHNNSYEKSRFNVMRIYDNDNVEHKKAILIHHVTAAIAEAPGMGTPVSTS